MHNPFSIFLAQYNRRIEYGKIRKWISSQFEKRIKKLDYENRTKLYNYLYNYNSNINNDNIEKYLNDLFIGDINIQRNINDYKNKTLIFK